MKKSICKQCVASRQLEWYELDDIWWKQLSLVDCPICGELDHDKLSQSNCPYILEHEVLGKHQLIGEINEQRSM